MKKAIFTILVFSLVLSGCSLTKNDDKKVGLANPASTFCIEQGGKLEMRDNDAGQYGVCKFEDGSECEEWKFFRLECKPGQVTGSTEQVTQDKEQKVEKDENITKTGNDKIKVIGIESGDNIISPITIKGEGIAFENNLIVELRNKDHKTLVKEFTTIKSTEVGKSGPFEIKLNFEFNNTKEGYLAVYEESTKDGSELNLVEISVRFNDKETLKTYKNEEYGFEFQNEDELDISVEKMSSPLVSQISFVEKNGSKSFVINIYNKKYTSFEDFGYWHKEVVKSNTLNSTKKIKVSSYDAIKTIETDGIDSTGEYIYLLGDDYVINFKCKNNLSDRDFLSQYLSTFKFTN